ncbi:MAG TPA: type II toxin-antitoxin system antitoxin SocA domain-containing protein [Rhizomicrobium sp.]|nr:type II toxin-antitoxin system antitoxin SocA domain-containing protein [Rhizomicrobium sp.]
MSLLKVLYFAHGWHLAKYDKPLIAQPFEAWKHGPVARVVYEQYKDYGKRRLNKKAVSFDPLLMEFATTPYSFDEGTKLLLENTFDYYIQFHAFKLSELTHEKGGPWDQVWEIAQDRAVPGMIIPNDVILSWFKSGNFCGSTYSEQTDGPNGSAYSNTSPS